jgi:hypothetical protein
MIIIEIKFRLHVQSPHTQEDVFLLPVHNKIIWPMVFVKRKNILYGLHC